MTRMRRISADHRKAAKLGIIFLFLGAQASLGAQAGTPALPGNDNCLKCHAQSTGRAAEVVKIHLASAHGKARVNCGDCHGGDPDQADKMKAHAANFVGKPDRNATLAMCGSCHDPQLAQFKTGKHFPEKQGIPRLDCAECHGAHAVGNPPETFSFGQVCVSCHGLEYLPALPQQFQELLNLADDLRDDLKLLVAKGRQPSDEITKQRRQIRRLTAELVHPTDRAGGLERIPQILAQGESLKLQIRKAAGER